MRQHHTKNPVKPHLHLTHRRLSAVFFYLAILIGVMVSLPIMVTPKPSFADLNPKLQAYPAAASVFAGVSHSVQLDYDGLVYVWGDNSYSQLGMDVGDHTDTPTYLEMTEPALAVSAGAYHTLVLGQSGTVYAFGRNAYGQIGNGTVANVETPDTVIGLPPIKAIAAGAYHSLALGQDGSIWAWGHNTQQQVGDVQSEQVLGLDGEVLALRNVRPVKIVESGATQIAAGGNFSLYIDESGYLHAWGDNSKGQLGDGTTESRGEPQLVSGISQITAVAAGSEHVLAISRESGYPQLYVWGNHALGQLGLGKLTSEETWLTRPTLLDFSGDLDPTDERIIGVYAGFAQSGVIRDVSTSRFLTPKPRHELYVWGLNNKNQLGIARAGSQFEPYQIEGFYEGYYASQFLPFESIAFGSEHLLVQSSKGLLASAGQNNRGQLGFGGVVAEAELTGVVTSDLIRPRWLLDQTFQTSWKEQMILRLSWPEAQDNSGVAGYWVELTQAGTEPVVYDAGQYTRISIPDLTPSTPMQIKVFAYDLYSKEVPREELGHLTGYILPEGQSIHSYFIATAAVTAPLDLDRHNWQPDESGHRQAAEVPWTLNYVDFKQKILSPYFFYSAGLAILLLILSVFYLNIRSIKLRRKSAGIMESEGEIEAG